MKYDRMVQERWKKEVLAEGGYFCGRLLGQGAFSRVYRVENQADGRVYACKISENIRLLEREAQIMAKLQHPLFPEYFGLWKKAGTGFLFMEYVPGENMEEMLKRRRRFGLRQAVCVGMELAEGLRCLQERRERLVYRDVKPANSVIRQDGRVKLLDFGCVCHMGEKTGSCAGTPGFAAPEQLRCGEVLTASCDVYGWGQTMRAMLGIREEDNIGIKSIDDIFEKGELSGLLLQILDACTKKEPAERIPDMRSVMTALAPLCAKEEKRRRKGAEPFFQKGMICEKNIAAIGEKS